MQGASSCGRNVTDAVICRNIDWISRWISTSVLSGCGGELLRERGKGKLRISLGGWGGEWEKGKNGEKREVYIGAEFSLSAGFCAVGFLLGLLKIWTFHSASSFQSMRFFWGPQKKGEGKGVQEEKQANYVKLPPLDMVASLFVGNDDDEFGDFATSHPFVKLGHDLFDVGFDLIVDCD